MTDKVKPVDYDALQRLQAVAVSTGKAEMEKLIRLVVADLCGTGPFGVFDDVLARHAWDEVCWCQQEGPYMVNLESMVRAVVSNTLDQTVDHTLVCLTAHSQNELGELDESGELAVGEICRYDIENFAYQRLQEEARKPNVGPIGHSRADELGFHLVSNGVVFSELPEDELTGALLESLGELIDSGSDLSMLADTLAQAFLDHLDNESESFGLSALRTKFAPDLRKLLSERDILPDLIGSRANLLEALDTSV